MFANIQDSRCWFFLGVTVCFQGSCVCESGGFCECVGPWVWTPEGMLRTILRSAVQLLWDTVSCWPAESQGSSCLCFHSIRIKGAHCHHWLLNVSGGAGNPCACKLSALSTQPPPQPCCMFYLLALVSFYLFYLFSIWNSQFWKNLFFGLLGISLPVVFSFHVFIWV